MSAAARTIFGIVSDIPSLSEYEVGRQALWAQLQALEDAEQEAVSGYISQKLSELLIRKTVQELVRVKGDLQLPRQYFLWDQLAKCRKYGMEDLAVYFLQIKQKHYIRVLLPPAMGYHNDAQAYYACARTFAILYYQIPVCQRKTLFEGLLSAVEYDAMDAVVNGKSGKETDAIRDLYLAMQTEKSTGYLHYWQAICYARHALDKNTKNDKEET